MSLTTEGPDEDIIAWSVDFGAGTITVLNNPGLGLTNLGGMAQLGNVEIFTIAPTEVTDEYTVSTGNLYMTCNSNGSVTFIAHEPGGPGKGGKQKWIFRKITTSHVDLNLAHRYGCLFPFYKMFKSIFL
jgi:hypothetical protein